MEVHPRRVRQSLTYERGDPDRLQKKPGLLPKAGLRGGLCRNQAARDSRSIVLAESIIDALSAYRLGCPSALALYGLNGLTDDHLALFRRYETAEVTLLLDNDEPAETALPALVERLKDLPLRVLRARLPEGVKDLNDFLAGGATAGDCCSWASTFSRLSCCCP